MPTAFKGIFQGQIQDPKDLSVFLCDAAHTFEEDLYVEEISKIDVIDTPILKGLDQTI